MPAPLRPHETTPRARRLVLATVALLAFTPSFGTLGAPLLADDGAILGSVARRDVLADLWGPQYGLELIRFWRPLTTWSWAAQLATTGVDPLPLRALNLACHLATACLGATILFRLRAPYLAALATGATIALFPYQGGTVTWVAGRVDSLCACFVLLAGATALGPRPALAALPAALACATKEQGFCVVAWIVLLRWAAGDAPAAVARRTWVPCAAVLACLLWRSVALGTAVGGYGGERPTLGSVVRAASAWAPPVAPLLLGMAALSVLALVLHGRAGIQGRLALAGLGIGVAGFAPLLPMLSNGVLEEQNARWLLAGEAGFALTVGAACWGARELTGKRVALVLPLALLLLQRGRDAWLDTHEWAEAGGVAEQRLGQARALVAGEPPSERPVLFDGFPVAWEGAYCLGFGAVDRLRAPFEPSPRPVWPLRPLFGARSSQRPPARALRPDGSLRPWEDLAPPALRLLVDGAPATALVLGEDVLTEGTSLPLLRVEGADPGTRLEWIAYTELGYEPAAWCEVGSSQPAVSLRDLLLLGNGRVSLGQALLLSADSGAERGYLELRALDADGVVLASSAWIELTWPRSLVARAALAL